MDWKTYFEHNRARRMAIPWDRGITVEPHMRAPLIRSLQRFQVGEQGDGAHLRMAAAATGDPAYAAAITLFVEEEQEHARLLARLLRGMGGTMLQRHWSDICFVFLRRLSGLHLELLVLLVAELIAKRYYRALHEGTSDPVLKTAFAQILHDEMGHVAFHCDYLQHVFAPLPPYARLLIRAGWQLLFQAASLVVMYDHRGVLRATRVSPGVFLRDCGLIFDEAAARIFDAAPALDEAQVASRIE